MFRTRTNISEAIQEAQQDFKPRKDMTLYGWAKLIGALFVVASILYTVIGQVYTIPQKVERHNETLILYSGQLNTHSKEIIDLQNRATVNRTLIDGVQKSVDAVVAQQQVSIQQQSEINKNIIELTTSMKHYNESLKELKEDVRRIMNRAQNESP